MKYFLTENGNILVVADRPFFINPKQEFLREVSLSECEFLQTVCMEIEPKGITINLPEFYPQWLPLKSIKMVDDYSRYKPETSCNGGDYSFHEYFDWYVAQFPNGEWKFGFVHRHVTSSEFSYDELTGTFQNDLGYINLTNTNTGESYRTQTFEWDDEGNRLYSQDEVFEKIGNVSDFSHLWQSEYGCDDGISEISEPALTISEKKEIIITLKNLGMTIPPRKFKTPRRSRGGGNRR